MKRKGFTIIELLISISIIGILATIVILEYGSVQVRARDAQRIKDLDKIRYGLIAYRQDYGANPSNLSELVSKGYLEVLPADPNSTKTMPYQYNSVGLLRAQLEDAANRPTNIISGTILGSDCNGKYYCLQF